MIYEKFLLVSPLKSNVNGVHENHHNMYLKASITILWTNNKTYLATASNSQLICYMLSQLSALHKDRIPQTL